jgi:hypothetical protein
VRAVLVMECFPLLEGRANPLLGRGNEALVFA